MREQNQTHNLILRFNNLGLGLGFDKYRDVIIVICLRFVELLSSLYLFSFLFLYSKPFLMKRSCR